MADAAAGASTATASMPAQAHARTQRTTNADSAREDRPCKLQVAGVACRRILLPQVAQGGLEARGADLAIAGDETGGIVARTHHHFVIAGGTARGGRRPTSRRTGAGAGDTARLRGAGGESHGKAKGKQAVAGHRVRSRLKKQVQA